MDLQPAAAAFAGLSLAKRGLGGYGRVEFIGE